MSITTQKYVPMHNGSVVQGARHMIDDQHRTRIVTISASYGAGGSVIAPQVAQRLGIPFYDRLLVGTGQDADPSETISDDELADLPLGRLLTGFAFAGDAWGLPADGTPLLDDRRLREHVESSLRPVLEGEVGVVLGRAGAVVLARKAGVMHVRIDGPFEKRVQIGKTLENIDERTARRRLNATDRARTAFVKRLYGTDPREPSLYHLILDGTAFSFEDSADLIANVARVFWKPA